MESHGYRNSPEYRAWSSMKSRCNNPRHASYEDYGGRGIYVCERWVKSFSDFLSDMGHRPFPGAHLERVDNDGPYSPENCVWASRKTQARNRRNTVLFEVDGRRITIAEMSEMSGIGYQTIRKRLDAGWPADQAAKTPLMSFKEAGIKSARRFLARPA